MILISLGSNLPSQWGNSKKTIERALEEMEASRLKVLKKTPIIETKPVSGSKGGAYANAVAEIASSLPPKALLMRLKLIEHMAGRREARFASVLGKLPRWRARALDLDILDWHGVVMGPQDGKLRTGYVPLTLPHPRLYEREFISALLGQLEDA